MVGARLTRRISHNSETRQRGFYCKAARHAELIVLSTTGHWRWSWTGAHELDRRRRRTVAVVHKPMMFQRGGTPPEFGLPSGFPHFS